MKEKSVFEDGFQVGNKPGLKRVILTIGFIILASLFLTGFGYQPLWLFILILVVGLVLTFPVCFDSYWTIHPTMIEIGNFSQNDLVKLMQLLKIKPVHIIVIKHQEIDSLEINYHAKKRFGPFDITADQLTIDCHLKDGRQYNLNVSRELEQFLPDFEKVLNESHLELHDPQEVLSAIKNGENLYEHFN